MRVRRITPTERTLLLICIATRAAVVRYTMLARFAMRRDVMLQEVELAALDDLRAKIESLDP